MEQRDPQMSLADQFVVDTPSVGLPWRLMIFSIVLFVFSLFIFAGVKFGYTSFLDGQKKKVESDIAALGKKVSKDDQEKYVNFYSQTLNLRKVLERHQFSGNIFKFLQEKTAVNVYYTGATYGSEERKLTIQGIAATSEALIQQLSVFDAAPELKSSVLTQMRYTEGGRVSFEIDLVFIDEFFKSPASL